jgi:hypothetical protein
MNKNKLCTLIIIFCLTTVLCACARYPYPILNEDIVDNIISGKSTETDVIELFGIPDIVVCDTGKPIIPENSNLSEILKVSSKYPDSYAEYISQYINSKIGYFLSSGQKTIIYFEPFYDAKHGGGGGGVWWLTKQTEYHIERIARNEIVVFINNKNGIVDDYAYRKEWNWEEYNAPTKMMCRRIDRADSFTKGEIDRYWSETYCNKSE